MPANATIQQLADHFAISLSTARKWVYGGRIPDHTYVKIGQTYRFDIEKVDAALLAAKVDAPATKPEPVTETTHKPTMPHFDVSIYNEPEETDYEQ